MYSEGVTEVCLNHSRHKNVKQFTVLRGANSILDSKAGIYCLEFAQRTDLIICKGAIFI